MRMSRARLKQIIVEETHKMVDESMGNWFRGQMGMEAWRDKVPSGRAGEIFHLFYGDDSLEGPKGSHHRLKRARSRATQAEQDSRELSTSAYHLSRHAQRAHDAGRDRNARQWAEMAKQVEQEIEDHADEFQPDFNLIEIYDFLVNENILALQLAEKMIDEKGIEKMSAIAMQPELAAEFIDRHVSKGTARAKKVMRIGILPDKWE